MRAALPDVMTAARIDAPGRTSVGEVPTPRPGAGEVLIEVARAGICGTDVHIHAGSYDLARYPLTPGHEFAGTIRAVGSGVRRRVVGERVTADPNVPCLTCPECLRGAFNQCHDLEVLGVTTAGAFARFVVAPERVVYALGELSFAAGAMVEPLACVLWGLKRVPVRLGDAALVYGAGPMGCLLLQALRAAGAGRVAVVDPVPARLDTARTLGADVAVTPDEAAELTSFAPSGFEVVVEATGLPTVLEEAVTRARPGGTVWVFGVAEASARASIPPFDLFRRDLALVGSFALNRTMDEAVCAIRDGAIRVAPLVSHVLPLAAFAEGMRIAVDGPDRMKVHFAVGASGGASVEGPGR